MRGIGFIRLRIGIVGSPCECDIEPPGSIILEVSYIFMFYNLQDNLSITTAIHEAAFEGGFRSTGEE